MVDYRENNKWTVYIHTSPSNKYYVGITSRSSKTRWGNNGNGYKKQHFHFYNAIQKYGWDNFNHEIIAEHLTKDEAMNLEIILINKLNSNIKEFGYNMTIGGECGNVKPTYPVYQYNLNGDYIKSFKSASDASREVGCHRTQITKICKGKSISICGFMWKYYKVNKIEAYNRINYKQVNQYDKNNNFIKSYNSIISASIETDISEDCIVKCCKHKNKTAGNYIWEYVL